MKNKIKFLNFPYIPDRYVLSMFKIVNNPTIYKSVPDGEYVIRGDKKLHATEYWVQNNVWYLIHEFTPRDMYYDDMVSIYHLFPNLPEKEWELLNKVYHKLSPYWKSMVNGRNMYMKTRDLEREIKLSYIKNE